MKSVLISGAGIAGPTLAYWLKRAGYVPTLVERAPALRRGGYVIDFWGLGYDIAERMGLLPAIDRAGYHVREMRIVDDGGRRVAGFGTSVFDELTGGRFVTLARSDLSRLLFGTIADSVEVVFDEEIIALDERADGVGVRLRRGGERRFDLVIGADGLHSQVRRLLVLEDAIATEHGLRSRRGEAGPARLRLRRNNLSNGISAMASLHSRPGVTGSATRICMSCTPGRAA